MTARDICVDCQGDGKCSECTGSGTNVHLNEDEPKCRKCSGTGVCPTCQGTGRWYVRPPDVVDLGLDKL